MEQKSMSRKANIFIFIVALIGALSLWLYSVGYDTELHEQMFMNIKVEPSGVNPNNLTVVDENAFSFTINVRASGTRSALSQISSADFKAYVDISAVTEPGEQYLPIVLIPPNGVKVSEDNISTNSMYIFIDEKVRKPFDVQINARYPVQEGQYELVDKSVKTIHVNGPKSVLENIEAYCEVDLSFYEGDVANTSERICFRDIQTKTQLPESKYRYISVEESEYLELRFTKYAQKDVPVSFLWQDGSSVSGYVASHQTVTLRGPVKELNGISSLIMFCDPAEADGKERCITFSELFQKTSSSKNIEPEDPEMLFKYTLSPPELKTRVISIDPSHIMIADVPEGVFATVTEGITVTIGGSSDAVDAYDPSQMTVTVRYDSLKLTEGSLYIGKAVIALGNESICLVRQDDVPVRTTVNAE